MQNIHTPRPKNQKAHYLLNQPKYLNWIRQVAKWWSEDEIDDKQFVGAIQYLINQKIIQIPHTNYQETNTNTIPDWVKENARWWSENQIEDTDFVSGIQYMLEIGILVVNFEKSTEQVQKEKELEFNDFEKYLRDIAKNIVDEKRYIEFPNPSQDVIKKFLRDYIKWNFEEEAEYASGKFPDPKYEIIDNTVVMIYYTVFVNEQPSGLPLDHVSTFDKSVKFWENSEGLSVNNQKAKVNFSFTTKKNEANIWVTWVVRDLGEGILGHAHLGKGIVEVALGDYSCDGSFQLYDVSTVERIMRHELGHSIGLQHVSDPNHIMYPSMKPKYAYCFLDLENSYLFYKIGHFLPDRES